MRWASLSQSKRCNSLIYSLPPVDIQSISPYIYYSIYWFLKYIFNSWVSRDVINFTGVNSKSMHCHQTEKIFAVCVDLVFGSKCVQFREICLLQCSTIINTIWVDPHSELLKKVPVKPKNTS